MKDEELLARKKRLSAILLHRLNRHFYPLACRSFSLDALSIDHLCRGRRGALCPGSVHGGENVCAFPSGTG